MMKTVDEMAPNAMRGTGNLGLGTALRGLRRHPLLALLFFGLAAGVSSAIWFYWPLPKLTGYTTFHIQAQPATLFTAIGDAKADFKLYCQAQAALIKSRPVLSAALNRPEIAGLRMLQGHRDPFVWLDNNLKVDFRMSPEFMRLALEGDDAAELKALVEAIRTAYLQEVVDKDRQKRRRHLEQLEEVYKGYERLVAKHRDEMRVLAEDIGSAEPQNMALKEKFLSEQLGMAERELLQLQSEMRRAQIETQKLEEKVKGTEKVVVSDEAIRESLKNDAEFRKLLERRDAIRDSIDNIKATFNPGVRPPILVEREEQLAATGREIDSYVERARPALAAKLKNDLAGDGKRSLVTSKDRMEVLKGLEAAINADIERLEKRVSKAGGGQVKLEDYKQQIAKTERMADRIQQEIDNVRPDVSSPARVDMWEEPTVIAGIEGNRRLKYSLLAGGGVLAVGFGLITLLESRNRRVVATHDVAENLGLRLIGTVPLVPHRLKASAAAPGQRMVQWQSMLTDSVDATRTMLVHSADAKSSTTLLIASALPGEGKTMLATHLASSLARTGSRTLLIDGDLRRPMLHRVFGEPVSPGLCELLRGEASPGDTALATVVPNLSFIPGGIWDERVPQSLAGERWRTLKSQLAAQYDYIVLDSSPLLLVPDALLIAQHTDGAVLSVLQHHSEIDAVSQARGLLTALGVKVLGVVVNGIQGHKYRAAYAPYTRVVAPSPG